MTTISKIRLPELVVEPQFTISEVQCPTISDKKEGRSFRAIVEYQVVGKTKSYTTLKIKGVTPFPSKRIL